MRANVTALLDEMVRLHSTGDRAAKGQEILAHLDEHFMEWADPEEDAAGQFGGHPPDPPPVPRPAISMMKYACGATCRGPGNLPVTCPIHGTGCKKARRSFEP